MNFDKLYIMQVQLNLYREAIQGRKMAQGLISSHKLVMHMAVLPCLTQQQAAAHMKHSESSSKSLTLLSNGGYVRSSSRPAKKGWTDSKKYYSVRHR
jgi:hypothetical protein